MKSSIENGKELSFFSIAKCCSFGRDRECNFQISSLEVSRKHALIERTNDSFVIKDLGSKIGTLLNGRHIKEAPLVYGDVLNIGRHMFRFTGQGVERLRGEPGAAVAVRKMSRLAGEKVLLNTIDLRIASGEFVGILGTSGAGKSTLLDTLAGLKPPSSGEIQIDGIPIADYLKRGPSSCGYVPQSDIVHYELTVRQAIFYAACLRLPSGTPEQVIHDCVDKALERLLLETLADIPISRVSGGQRKRVSVAVEILSRPSLLFLDEPSSGLDPATEAKLMEQLRDLANLGCTVVCTTHIMDNVHIFDRLLILRSGFLIFDGPPEQARKHFQIDRFVKLYERIESRPVDDWVADFSFDENRTLTTEPVVSNSLPTFKGGNKLRILLARQLTLFFSDLKASLMLVGQPLLIGSLVSWVAEGSGFKLFFAHLATFWFGCSNASQEIVKEAAIYRRERLVAVSRFQYLASKIGFWLFATIIQAFVMYAALHVGPKQLAGDMGWQITGLLATAAVGISIGFCLSSWAKSATQATMLVPLILLPQLILSGKVLPPVKEDGPKKIISEFLPGYSSQFLMDTSLLWKKPIDLSDKETVKDFHPAHQNVLLQTELNPGDIFDDNTIPIWHLKRIGIWCLVATAATWLGLKNTESK